MSTARIILDGVNLDADELYHASQAAIDPKASLSIDFRDDAKERITKAENYLHDLAHSGKIVYGVNTGFGYFARTHIKPHEIEELQENIILSHACGVGELLPRDLVMSMWLIMLNSICRGHRGLAFDKTQHLAKLLEKGMLAHVPSRGSVGASGDLAPMAHAVLATIGHGMCNLPNDDGFADIPAAEALKKLKLSPLTLGAKEGLCLINGTQLTTAMAVKVWMEGQLLVKSANVIAAMMIEAMRASHAMLNPLILKEQRHESAAQAAQEVAEYLGGGTEISKSHSDCDRVQDPYSLRCIPQVHGAVAEDFAYSLGSLNLELNATTDNPILFPDEDRVLHGGNFHAIYSARTCDRLASGLATLCNISERRIHMAMKQEKSGLPNFLTEHGGLHSGFMMAQTTAAALVSEAKSLSFPASVDSVPTNNDQEDHVSMGPIAGLKALQILKNARYVLAIEMLAAAQGLDLLAPLKTSPKLEAAKAALRKEIPMLKEDRYLGADIEKAADFIASGALVKAATKA